ncbi:Hpt domain-containing protein [Arthrobacter sp.]|uniref:Hpt domain-containing protein n=1 Tax=Arthrobacter sp. TaxID=1667 RepID=UPI00289B753C|nr:Hpt domain-containing protein [Arthrobacter sp.]
MIAVTERPSSQTLVSTRVLRELSEQMGPETCRQFVGNYIDMWAGRFSRLVSALDEADFPGAMDVVLSIKISSQMAGAERLAALASLAQEMVRNADFCGLSSLIEPIQLCGEETLLHLSQTFPAR